MAEALEAALCRARDVADAGADNDVLLGALSDVKQAWETVGAPDHAVALGVITNKDDGLLPVLGKLHGTSEKRGWELLKTVVSDAREAASVAALQLVRFAQSAFFSSTETARRSSSLDFLAHLLSTDEALPDSVAAQLGLGALAKKLCDCLQNQDARSPAGVRSGIFAVLGAVCSRPHDVCPDLPGWLLGAALFVLNDEKSEGILQAAALGAATSALDATPQGSLRAENAEWVLRHAVKRLGEVTSTNRYGSIEAALTLLTKHSKGHLRPALLRQLGPVVEALAKCLAKDIVVDLAKRSCEAVFDALSDLLCDEQAASIQDRRAAYTIARALVDSLVKDAEAPIGGAADAEAAAKSKRRASAMALRAIGALAPAAVVMHEHPDQELTMVADVLQRLSGVTGSTSADAAVLAEHNVYRALSTGCARVLAVLDAYSRFWTALQRHSRLGGSVSAQNLSNEAIERTLVENAAWVVARFPTLGSGQRMDVCATLPRLLSALTYAGEDAQGSGHTARLLDTLTLRWLSSALETHAVTEATADMNTGAEVLVMGEPLWPRHVPLWTAMLAAQPSGLHLWDALCGHCMRLLSETLDLRIQRVKSGKVATGGDEDAEDTDLGEGWIATTPADVATAAHLCHLMAQLLPKAVPAACAARWAVAMALCLIDTARASPALPPLYALLAAVLTSPACGQAVAADETCAVVVRAFITECANCSRQEFGDVRDALLRLILSAPAELVSMGVAAPAAGAALRLGVTTPSMATMSLTALERLQETSPDALAPFLEADVIPGMAPLIMEAARREARGLSFADEAAQAAAAVAAAQAPGATGGRETAARAKRAARRGAEAARATLASDEDVSSCATRCQVLLGRWAGAAHALVSASAASGEARRRKRDVPKGGMRVSLRLGASQMTQSELSFDELLPHVTRLAQLSPDRVIKVAACELVHAIAVLLIGRQAATGISVGARLRAGQASAKEGDQLGLGPVYRHLYPALLALAVDAEKVASQLFMPLTTQLARWLGHSAPLSAPDRSAFLEALFDGASDNGNGTLREHCCGLVGILVQWTVKDMPATAVGLEEAVEDVLRRCYAALAHPDPWTRCGGASSLARVAQHMVRVQADDGSGSAVSVPLPVAVRHAVQVVRRCCDSLARADGDPIGCGATGFTLIACRRFTRIVASQAHNATLQTELAGLADDMWRLTATPSIAARAEAQRLVCELVPRVSQGMSMRQWLQSRDAGCMSHVGTPQVPPPSAGPDSHPRWFAHADAALQWAGWALGKDILSPGDLAALHAGPELLSPCKAAQMVLVLLHHTSTAPRSPQAASAALRVILLLVADASTPGDAGGGAVTSVLTASDDARARVCELLLLSLFNPTALGVGLERPATALELTAAAAQLVATCMAAAPLSAGAALGETFTHAFRRLLLAPTPDDAKVFPIGVSIADVIPAYGRGNAVALAALMSGYDALSSTGCMARLLPSPSDVTLKLASAAAALPADAPVGQVQLARRGLAVARKLNLSSRALLELLLTGSSAGLAFFERFKDQVTEFLIQNDVGVALASLVAAIAAGSAPAKSIAEAVLDAARVSLALAPDAHAVPPTALPYGQLLGAVAAHLGALKSLCCDSPTVPSKRIVLSLLSRALDLDELWHRTGAAHVLDAESLVGLFAALLTPVGRPSATGAAFHWRMSADVSVATDALALLAPHFGGLAPEKQAPIAAAISALCSPACVPLLGAAKVPTGHPDRASYLALRRALLQALVDCAQRGQSHTVHLLLASCVNVIVWDRAHQDVAAACDALGQAAWGKQQRDSGVADAIAAAAMLQLTETHTRLDSPTAVVAMLLRPLLRAAPQAFIARFYAQHVVDMLRLADVRSSSASFAPPTTGEAASAISVAAPPAGHMNTIKRMAVYALLQTLHECGAWLAALELAQEAWHAGKAGQEKLTVAWTRRLTQELKTEGVSFPAVYTTDAVRTKAPLSDSERRAVRLAEASRACRAAAFAALCALLAATQGADKLAGLVTKLLSGDWFLDKSWSAVVDCISPVVCRIDVAAIGPTRKQKASNLLTAAGVAGPGSQTQSTLSRSLRVQATVDSSLSASLEVGAAEPPPGGDVDMEGDGQPATQAEAADDLPDADTTATPAVDILDEGPVLDALVRLLEQCARVYAGEVQELAQQQMCASPPVPTWLAPLLRALDGHQPLAPPNARLLMAKAVLRLHGRAHEAQEQRDLVKALKTRMQGASREEWMAALADAGARGDVTLGASMNLPLAMATLREDSALGGASDADLAARRAVPLIRRGRPHKSLPAQLAVALGARLVDVFVPDTATGFPAGGRALHDVLRQTCWFLLDAEMLWSSVAAGSLGDTFGAALGRLMDHLVVVADAGQGSGTFTAANIDLLQILVRRAAANWTAVVASHPSRAHIAELLRASEDPKRLFALRLLTALMTPYEQWSQPLAFDVYQGDSMASAIVQRNVPQVSSGERTLGRKQLYTAAGLCLGLELAHRHAAGRPEPSWLATLTERLRGLGAGGDGIAPCVFTLASVAEHYPLIACLDDMRLCLTENLARTFGDVRWAALETLAVASQHATPAQRALLFEAIDHRLEALTSAAADDGALERVVRLMRPLLLKPWLDGDDSQRRETAARDVARTFHSALHRHRSAAVRLDHVTLLRDLASAWPDMLKEDGVRQPLLAGVVDSLASVRDVCMSFWDGVMPADAFSSRLHAMLGDAYTADAQMASSWPTFATAMLLKLPARNAPLMEEPLLGEAPLSMMAPLNDVAVDTRYRPTAGPSTLGLGGGMATLLTGGLVAMTQQATLPQAMDSLGGGSSISDLVTSATQDIQPEWLRRMTAAPPGGQGAAAAAAAGRAEEAAAGPAQVAGRTHRPGAVRPSRRLLRAMTSFGDGGDASSRGSSSADRRSEQLRSAASQAGHDVRLLRRYRAGDYPDVRVSRNDYVRPLAALVLRDADTARIALTALSKCLWSEVGVADTQAAVRLSLARMLGNVTPDATLLAALHGVAVADVQHRDQPGGIPSLIDTSAVAALSLRARQVASGIILVENAVLYGHGGSGDRPDAAAGPSTKRRRLSPGGDLTASPADSMHAACSALAHLLGRGGDEVLALQVTTSQFDAAPGSRGVDAAEADPSTRALHAMLAGDDATAAAALEDAIAVHEEGGRVSQEGEGDGEEADQVLDWQRDRLHLLQRMGDWTIAAGEAHRVVEQAPHLDGTLGGAWASQPHRFAVDCLLRAAVRLPQERALVMGDLSTDVQRDAEFRKAHALELAQLDMLLQPRAPDAAAASLAVAFRAAREAWAAAPAGAAALRHGLIATWQASAELAEALPCLRALSTGAPVDATNAAEALASPWLRRWPSPLHAPGEAVELVVASRLACLDALQALGADGARMEAVRRHLHRGAGDAARRCGALSLAQKYLGAVDQAQRDGHAPFDFSVQASLIKILIAQADASGMDALRADGDLVADLLMKPMRAVSKALGEQGPAMEANPQWLLTAHSLRSALLHRLSEVADESQTQEAARMGVDALGAAREAVAVATRGDTEHAAKSLLHLAQLLDDALTGYLAGDTCASAVVQAASGPDAAAQLFCSAVLGAAARGGSQLHQVRGALPRVLSLLGQHAGAREAFKANAAQSPLWLFLPWVNQLLAALNGPEAAVLLPLLQALASAYPHALHFPVRIVADGDNAAAALARDHLAPLVSSAATAAFGRAVEDVCFPHVRLQAWLETILPLAERAGADASLRPRMVTLLRRMAQEVASEQAAQSRGAGIVNLKFARAGERSLQQRLGGPPDFPAVTQARGGWEALPRHLQHFNSDMAAAVEESRKAAQQGMSHTVRSVESLSMYLSRLRAVADDPVELPGQYAAGSATCAPDPSRHRRVVGADPVMRIMNSKQVPVVIKLRCDDGSEATFLAKGGEDVRLDARMQTLFRTCATSMAADRRACARGLDIPTFHVEPLSTMAGLLAWLHGSQTLHEVLREALPAGLDDQCYEEHSKWVVTQTRSTEAGNTGRPYAKLAVTPERQVPAAAVAAHLARLHTRLPAAALRDVLLARAHSAEAFLASRRRYEATLIAGCAAVYVCGVGDRHLGNIMLDGTGALTHIDFGYSFGSGLSLVTPELVPFRLTRSLAGACAPYDRTQLLAHDLGLALEALHASSGPLCAAMDIFVNEPLDWTREARRMGMAADGDTIVAHKLAVARDKLELANPVAVFVRELRSRYKAAPPEEWRALVELLRGSHSDQMRNEVCARGLPPGAATVEVAAHCASAEEQAAILVDMARDPNILGRAWVGWRPWL